jgi:hypothetical protein
MGGAGQVRTSLVGLYRRWLSGPNAHRAAPLGATPALLELAIPIHLFERREELGLLLVLESDFPAGFLERGGSSGEGGLVCAVPSSTHGFPSLEEPPKEGTPALAM